MTIQEALNRTTNLVGVSIVALSGLAFLPEAFVETELLFKLDEILLFILGLTSIFWYRKLGNNIKRSLVPLLVVLLSLIFKAVAVFLEFKDPTDVGDDFGALILFLFSFLLVFYLYTQNARIASSR